MKKEYIVIGAGQFGSAIAVTISEMGNQVLVIDRDENKINSISDKVTHTIVADATDEKFLKSLDLNDFDTAIVGIGEDIKSSMLVTLMAKECGVKQVICKALDEVQAKVLYKIGADKVVFPERDMGIKVAQGIISANILDAIELDPEYFFIEIKIDEKWIGKSLKDLNFRAKYGINVLAIKNSNGLQINPHPEDRLKDEDILLIIGNNKLIGNMLKE